VKVHPSGRDHGGRLEESGTPPEWPPGGGGSLYVELLGKGKGRSPSPLNPSGITGETARPSHCRRLQLCLPRSYTAPLSLWGTTRADQVRRPSGASVFLGQVGSLRAGLSASGMQVFLDQRMSRGCTPDHRCSCRQSIMAVLRVRRPRCLHTQPSTVNGVRKGGGGAYVAEAPSRRGTVAMAGTQAAV